MAKKKYLVTSALPYANGALHLGHLAGAYLPADIYVRYRRLRGDDIVFVCGSDEHGAAITIRSKHEGISPKDIIDKYHSLNKATFEKLGISFDMYHRTSDPTHHETAQDFFTTLFQMGDQFEERSSEQYYDQSFNQFLADRYIKGTCPNCGYEEAYGDQCENCGSDLSPEELINPVSTLSQETPVKKETKHWYFKLDQHADWLKEWVQTGKLDGQFHHDPKGWKNHVIGQCMSWLDSGLKPRSITRDLDWGIPVPLAEAEGKVLYVWFDAPIGYISATKQWARDHGKDWESYWKSPDSELIHFIGKDNIVFHCVIFPAMLKAYGGFNLPINVPANQFLNFEGQKFSKSKNWGIEQHEYLDAFATFPNKEDALRYALIRNMPENKDSDFRWDDFVEFHDKELADNLGNFINRVVVLTNKYFEGACPDTAQDLGAALAEPYGKLNELCEAIEQFSFKQAVQSLMEVSSWGNTFLQEASPWKIWKQNPDDPRVAEAMVVALQLASILSVFVSPFLPFTASKLRKLLQMPALQDGDLQKTMEDLGKGKALIPAGHLIGQPEVLFPKIQDRKDDSRLQIIEAQKAKLVQASEPSEPSEPSYPPVKSTIQFEDFTKLDLRTGTISEAEKIPKAKKLLKLTVNLGFEKRTIVSGIATFFKPEEIIGKQVIIVANLAPRTLRGVESQGMVLMAEDVKGQLTFVSPSAASANGLIVR